MRKVALTLIIALLNLMPVGAQASRVADLVFTNGNVYTVGAKQPSAEAIAIKDGRFVYVGTNAGAKRFIGTTTKVVDLKGATVTPGFTDSHVHLTGIGFREMTLNLEGITNLQAFLAKVKERVDQTKTGEWVTGRGWIETHWTPPNFPTRRDLDAIAPNNPVYLTRADGHASVTNSMALKMAGVTRDTPNPFGGEILKEKQTGELHGMLIDRSQGLVSSKIPASTSATIDQAVELGVKREIELGWTQVQDAGGTLGDVEHFRKLYREGKIKLRIYKAIHGPTQNSSWLIKEGAQTGEFENRFTLRSIKVVMDGALGSRGAALLAPYNDAPETSGFLTSKEEEVYPMLVEALKAGIQVETHAIGDRANRVILDLYERAFKAVPSAQRKIKDPRWRVEHAQILEQVDLARFAKLGVIPSMQPSHAIGDLFFAPSRLGIPRLAGAYAWQTLLKSGVVIAGGSDAPVERGEPMIEFYAAVARKGQTDGFTSEGWHPEQAASREQALKMFTIWPAYAAFQETQRGSIEPGKLADLSVWSADIMKIVERDILKTQCVMTVISGEIVYARS